MRVNASGDVDPLHLRAVLGVAENLLGGDDASLQYLLVVINIVNEGVKRLHPLLKTGVKPRPFLDRHGARYDIKRNQSFRAFFLTVDREGNSDAVKQRIRLGPFLREPSGGLVDQPIHIARVVCTRRTRLKVHFVIRCIAQ